MSRCLFCGFGLVSRLLVSNSPQPPSSWWCSGGHKMAYLPSSAEPTGVSCRCWFSEGWFWYHQAPQYYGPPGCGFRIAFGGCGWGQKSLSFHWLPTKPESTAKLESACGVRWWHKAALGVQLLSSPVPFLRSAPVPRRSPALLGMGRCGSSWVVGGGSTERGTKPSQVPGYHAWCSGGGQYHVYLDPSTTPCRGVYRTIESPHCNQQKKMASEEKDLMGS